MFYVVRLMWRRNGDGEAYVYHPSAQHPDFCQLPDTKCGGNAGTSVQRGKFKFTHEKWTKIALTGRCTIYKSTSYPKRVRTHVY